MVAFIDDHRADYGVELIGEVLSTARSTDHEHKARATDPVRCRGGRSGTGPLRGDQVWRANCRASGARKVWRQLGREQVAVARCTVERLVRQMALGRLESSTA